MNNNTYIHTLSSRQRPYYPTYGEELKHVDAITYSRKLHSLTSSKIRNLTYVCSFYVINGILFLLLFIKYQQ